MTPYEVIRMAIKCGIPPGPNGSFDALERFAALCYAKGQRDMQERAAEKIEAEAWRLKAVAVDTQSGLTNMRAVQASNDADAIRALEVTNGQG